jgi:hypothetical protein
MGGEYHLAYVHGLAPQIFWARCALFKSAGLVSFECHFASSRA